MAHKIRYMVHPASEITDAELDEFAQIVNFEQYKDSFHYEYSGHFILSTDITERDEAVTNMCCGIVKQDVKLESGKILYFAFDYGH